MYGIILVSNPVPNGQATIMRKRKIKANSFEAWAEAEMARTGIRDIAELRRRYNRGNEDQELDPKRLRPILSN